jgi:hypothetical protein
MVSIIANPVPAHSSNVTGLHLDFEAPDVSKIYHKHIKKDITFISSTNKVYPCMTPP